MAAHWSLIVIFSGYLPLIFTALFSVVSAWFYTHRYASSNHKSWLSQSVIISGLTFSSLTTLLLPLDVYFASYAKTSNGSFTEWARNSTHLQDVQDTIEDLYFGFYSVVLIYLFIILPFVYFYLEDLADPLLESTLASRTRHAFIRSFTFTIFFAILLAIGAVISTSKPDHKGSDWTLLAEEYQENRARNSFAFTFSIVSVVGLCTIIEYLGLGMMAFPLSLIRGLASAAKEHTAVIERQENLKARITVLKNRIQLGNVQQEDYRILTELQQQEAQSMRQERYLNEFRSTWWYRLRKFLRPMQIFCGVAGLSLSVLVLVSLILANVDKSKNSISSSSGYIARDMSLPNPMDYVLLKCQEFFPVDYLLFVTILSYLFICCIYSVQRFGVWICCFRAYTIRRRKTSPRGLIMLSWILILCVFGLNILVYSVSPFYMSFGNQYYNYNGTIKPCDYRAPPGDCVQTRASFLLNQFNSAMPAFNFGYYWLSWLYVMVSIVAFFVFQFKRRISAARQRIQEEDEDYIE